MQRKFERLCKLVAAYVGAPVTFVVEFLLIATAIGCAVVFDSLREVINLWGGAITSYVSILLLTVFQNSQNRSETATNAKHDEVIRATKDARNALIGAEELPSDEIKALRDSA